MKVKIVLLSATFLLASLGIANRPSELIQRIDSPIYKVSPWSDFNEGTVNYGSSYQIPKMTYTIDGKTYEATCIVTFPDGSKSAEKNISLNQAGTHVLEYSVNIGGEIHNITETIQVPFPQLSVGNLEKSSVKYVSTAESKNLGAQGSAGIYVKLGMGDTLNFTKPIYLDQMNDVNHILTGYIAPLSKGAVDFNQLFIKLTDAEDPETFVILCYYSHVETGGDGRTSHSSSAMARSSSQPYFAGMHQNQGLHTNDKWGLWCGVAFDGYNLDKGGYPDYVDAAKFTFGYDNSTKLVYGTGFGRGSTLEKVLDLDNVPDEVSSPFAGFKSNRAFLSVYADAYSGATANFVITHVDGITDEELAKNVFVDKEAPTIEMVDSFENMNVGAVGYSFPVPAAKAYDDVSLECPVKTEVFFNYFSSDKVNIKITDGKFYMDKAGTYTIRYTAKDKAGNMSEKLFTISVLPTLDKPAFDLPSYNANVKAGDFYTINRRIDLTGGVGNKTLKVYYEHKGEKTLVEGKGFRLEDIGEYKVIYEVTDAIGQITEKSFTIISKDSGEPILEKSLTLPRYFISGGYYEMPEEKVYIYENGAVTTKSLTLEVTDANGTKEYTSGSYSPKVNANLDKVTIKAKYDGKVLETKTVTGIKTIGTEENARYLNISNYFVSNGLNKTILQDGLHLKTTANQASFDFANPFLADSFLLDIANLIDFGASGGVTVSLIDALNEENKISAKIYLDNEVTYFAVGENKVALIKNDINSTGNAYSFSFEDGVFTCGTSSLNVTKFDNGDLYTGFEGEMAYLSFSFDNFIKGASLDVLSFCQTTFSSKTSRDRISPVVQMDNNYGGTRDFGSTYHINPAYSFDVYSPNVTFGLTVTSPSGKEITALDGTKLTNADPTKGYDISLDEYGEYYFSLTSIEDNRYLANGNEATISYSVRVYDDVAPKITFKSGMVKEAKVGDTVGLPTFEVSDNVTAKEELIIQRVMLSPSGKYYYLDSQYNGYTFKESGEYRYEIRVIDASGNITSKTFKIDVKA